MPASHLIVTLCTYNEKDNLPLIVQQIKDYVPDAHIVVIDDNSPDGTGILADELSQQDPTVHVVHRPQKSGLGKATIAGLLYAIEHEYQYVVNMDADLSHNPKHLPEMLASMEEVDVAVGSRYVRGGGVTGWGIKRHLMSKAINMYARICLGFKN